MNKATKKQQTLEELIAEGLASELVITNPKFWAKLEIKLFGKVKVPNAEK